MTTTPSRGSEGGERRLPLAPAHVERLLRLLGTAPREPSLVALRELVAAYVVRVPFENVSKLHRWRRHGLAGVPTTAEFLDGLEQGFGGTCYANNFHLHALLAALGYDVALCGADMSAPDVHVVVLARIEGRELLLDAGYAAPFVEPLPCDLAVDHVVALGRDRYVLHPRDAAGRSRLDLVRDGTPTHGYVVKPQPRRLEDFATAIADSFRPEATFRKALLVARFWPGASLYIHNLTVIEARGAIAVARQLPDREALIAEIHRRFGMPAAILREVVESLGELGDAWG